MGRDASARTSRIRSWRNLSSVPDEVSPASSSSSDCAAQNLRQGHHGCIEDCDQLRRAHGWPKRRGQAEKFPRPFRHRIEPTRDRFHDGSGHAVLADTSPGRIAFGRRGDPIERPGSALPVGAH